MSDEASVIPHQRVPYLPGLDGVRAFAVLAVMIYHGGISLTPGGFLGVDTFFVLSGFLITSLLVSEWQGTATIRLGAFWARRARRLLPALLLMLLFVAFYASVIVPRGTYAGLRLDALSTLLYVSNWHFVLIDTNYFAQTAQASPLIHTWSLAVEEQFYFIWPLVVLGLLRLTKSLRLLLVVSVVAALVSALLMDLLYDPATSTSLVYFGTDTRAQCIFIGAALSIGLLLRAKRSGLTAPGSMWHPESRRGRGACALIGAVGAAVTLAIWVLADSTSSFPYKGGFFLVGLGTAGVILAVVGAPRSPVPRFLALRPLRYVGQISYGLYIWHWPIFIWVNEARTGLSGDGLFVVRVLVTFAVSVVSYHLVERPIRRRTFLKNWRAWVAVPAGVGAVLVAVVVATTVPVVAASAPAAPKGGTEPPAVHGPPVRVLFIGDSVALTLGLGLGATPLESRYGYTMDVAGLLGCGVVDGPEIELMGVQATSAPPCNGKAPAPGTTANLLPIRAQWSHEMSTFHPNVVVLLAGRWEDVDRVYRGRWTNILDPSFARYVKSQLEATSNLVTAAGAHMVFMTTPCTNEGEQPNGAPWPEDDPARRVVYNHLVKEVAAAHPGTDSVVDLDATVCPGGTFTPTYAGVTIRRPDGVHFTTPQAGPPLAPVLMPPIVASGRAQMARVSGSG